MKKRFLLLILPIFLTGCYDYQELNNRAIVSGIAIDYEEEYKVTLEILNSKKSGSEENSSKTYYVKGIGETLAKAFQDASLKISKEPYFSHLKVMILSEDIAKYKLEYVVDYIIREPNIRNIFLPVVAQGCEAQTILQTTTKENPVSSEAIESMIENNKTSNHISMIADFETFMDHLVDERSDAYLNTLSKTKDAFELSGTAIFKGFQLESILDIKNASTFNTLNNSSENHFITIACPNGTTGTITINLYHNTETSLEVSDDNLLVKNNLKATIIEDNCGYDFRDTKSYEELQNAFIKPMEEEYQEFFQIIMEEQTDILGIQAIYYKKTRKDLPYWYLLNISYETKLDINKNGLIFKVS